MKYVTVLGVNKASVLLKMSPFWSGPHLDQLIGQKEIDENWESLMKLKFPAVMEILEERGLAGMVILKDEFGETWGKHHFVLQGDEGLPWSNWPPITDLQQFRRQTPGNTPVAAGSDPGGR